MSDIVGFRITTEGFERARDLTGAQLQAAVMRGMEKAMANAATQAKKNASGRPGPNVDTGRLRSSITHEVTDNGDRVTGVIGSDVVYARIHELGGVIVPRVAKHLRFQLPDGEWVTTDKVTIPARPYLQPAINSPFAQKAITEFIRLSIERTFKAVAT